MTKDPTIATTAAAFVRLLRPANSVMMGLAVIIGSFLALRGGFLPAPAGLGFVTAFSLTAASMTLNDYFDRAVDAVNQPNRPLPSGLVTDRGALILAAILGSIGLSAAFITNVTSLIVACLAFILSGFYNIRGKRWGFFGNLMVSATVAVPFVYGSFAVGLTPSSLLVMFAVLAFLSNTGREIIKGISDITGDAIRQVRTLARSFGPRRASQVAALFYFLAVGASAIPVIWIGVSSFYLPFVLAADSGFVYSAAIVLLNPSNANARKAKTLSLIWMLLGLIAFVLGGLPF